MELSRTDTHTKELEMTLVNWPVPSTEPEDSDWRSTGEGGMFAYAVWPTQSAECMVDVRPQMPLPDVMVRAYGPMEPAFEAQSRNHRYNPDANFYEEAFNDMEEVGTAVFLGSTYASLVEHGGGSYFSVEASALTEAGAAMVAALTEAYGTEPTFVTYLDT
jgi:hypothetical protein